MLIRRSAGLLATALLIGLTPPLMGESRAATSNWLLRFTVDFIAAQRVSQGKSVKIALLADGVASGVKTLKGRLEKEKDLVGTPRPKRVSGTLMASLIAGGAPTAGPFAGVQGLAPKATILPVRVYAEANEPGGRTWRDSADWGQNLAKGVRYAVDHGADVIAVNAYVTGSETTELSTAIAYAQSKKAVVVATTGVHQPDNPAYPAAAPGVIGVGTVTLKGRRDKKRTSRSSDTLVSAPDFEMVSVGPDNRLWTVGGDPVALAFTTAAVALVKSEYPRLTPAQVGQALSASARRPKGKGRYDTELGFGYLNAAGALAKAHKIAPRDAPAMTAKSSIPDGARLGGEKPGTIRAAPYDPLWIGGFGGLAFAGLVALGLAAWLALRRRAAPLPAPALPSEPADTTGT